MKIHVIGLGDTKEEYLKYQNELSIGVNDVHSFVNTDFVVCIDKPHRFSEDRKNIILNTKSLGFFTNLIEWNTIENFNLINLALIRGSLDELNSSNYCYSNNSPFVACILAYKMKAKEIILHGVDLINHHALSRTEQQSRALKDYSNLNNRLKNYGIKMYVSSKSSKLSDFLPLYR